MRSSTIKNPLINKVIRVDTRAVLLYGWFQLGDKKEIAALKQLFHSFLGKVSKSYPKHIFTVEIHHASSRDGHKYFLGSNRPWETG